MDIELENKWAVYPIEKIEAAIANLNEAIVEARKAQREAAERKRQVRAEQLQLDREKSLNLILCRGCQDKLPRYDPPGARPYHIYVDASGMEECMATPERKQQLREYFEKEFLK